MIGDDWLKGEDAKMEYEVVEDDSGIDWDDPDVIADIFAQTDTRLDRIFNKLEHILFGEAAVYFGIFICASMMALIVGNIIRWMW